MVSESVRIFLANTIFCETYFDSSPLEFDSYELLQTHKIISESVRIFLSNTIFFEKHFDGSPLEFESYELFQTHKMISESVCIFVKYDILRKVVRWFTPRIRLV